MTRTDRRDRTYLFGEYVFPVHAPPALGSDALVLNPPRAPVIKSRDHFVLALALIHSLAV